MRGIYNEEASKDDTDDSEFDRSRLYWGAGLPPRLHIAMKE
jgi:hypothetical protein